MSKEMKRTKVFVLVNTLSSVASPIYSNHIEFFVWTAKHRPDIDFIFYTPPRMSIDNARNTAARLAMESDCDYLMFIDDDVMIPPNTLDLLLKAQKPIVAGLVVIRGMPFNVMGFKWDSASKKHLEYSNNLPLEWACENGHMLYQLECKHCHLTPLLDLVPLDAVGFSCALIEIDVLKALEPPFFVTGKYHTEDVYFCMKTLQLEPLPEIYMHTGVKCGHMLSPEPIEFGTRQKFQEFYHVPEMIENVGRGIAYVDKCLAALK